MSQKAFARSLVSQVVATGGLGISGASRRDVGSSVGSLRRLGYMGVLVMGHGFLDGHGSQETQKDHELQLCLGDTILDLEFSTILLSTQSPQGFH